MKKLRPYHIALFIWLSIAVLGGISWAWQGPMTIGSVTLRWKTLSEVLGNEAPGDTLGDIGVLGCQDSLASLEIVDTVVAPPVVRPTQPIQPVITTAVTHNAAPLQPFFEALQQADRQQVRVVHYGDSQIEEDRISYMLRRNLQEAYGGGGVGLIPLHQTIPTRTLEQRLRMDGVVQASGQGPERNIVYGPKSMRREDGLYGPMGQVAMLTGEQTIELQLRPRSTKHNSEHYFSQIRLLADEGIGISVGNDSLVHSGIVRVQDSTMECSIRVTGAGKVYGLSLEQPHGIVLDNIPMRGSSGAIFTQIDSTQLSDFYRETNTRLIILQYGGNSLPNMPNERYVYGAVSQLQKQVQYLKRCAPEASFLFIGPSDMATQVEGEMQTYPLLPLMDSQLRRMADKEGIAYYSMYHAMGGSGSMIHWVEVGLASSDYVHFSRAGADKAAKMLWQWLMEQKEE